MCIRWCGRVWYVLVVVVLGCSVSRCRVWYELVCNDYAKVHPTPCH